MDSNSISIPNAMAPSNNSRNSGLAATADESAGEPSIPGSNRRLAGSSRSLLTPRSQFTDPARVKVVSPPPVASASSASSSASSSSAADGAISRAASGLAARAWSDDLQDTSTEDEDEDRRLEAAAFGSPISDAGSITDAPLLTQSSSMTSMAKKGAMKKVEPSAMATAKTLAADKENAQAKANATKDKTQWKSNVEKWHDADGENVLTPRGSKRKQKLKQEPLLRAVLQPTAASTVSSNAKNVTTPSAVRGAQPLSQSQQDDEAAFDDALTFALQMDQFQTPAEAAALPPLGPSHVLKPSTSLKSSAMRMMERSPLLRPLSSIQDDPEWGFRNASEVRPDLKDEFMSLCVLSYPVIFTYVLEFLPGIVSMTLVGHMDSPKTKEYVDGVSLSTMFMNLTGIALGFGLATAMDTLCSQAYGAGKPMKMGIYFQCGILVLGIAVIPVFLINWYTEQFLLWMGQPEEVAALAGRFSRLVLPGIPFLYVYELFKKLLQAQNVVKPMVYIAILSNVVNVLLGIYLTWYTTLGYDGAAIARTVANVVLPGALVPFFLWNPDVAKQWWPGWKFSQAIRYMRTFLTLGIPGMFMMMLEWWAFEIMAAFVGLLPNSVVAISVHSVLANVSTMAFNVFLGIGVATNIRVGNYVGSNQPEHAKMASVLGMVLSIAVSTLLALAILFTRNLLPMIFINDATSVALAAHACLYLIPYQMIDSINSVMQGVFRGTGYQTIGAYINLFGYFAVGLPLGVYLAFQWDYGVEGLWLGLTSGIGVGAVMSLYKVYHMDWNEMADTARLRAS